jgi:serine/threonine protein kinase
MKGFGRYNLLCKLGEGGMGVLYLARQKTLKRFCALKVIHTHLSKDSNCAERFLHEARSAASLSHPYLVNVFDCDQFEGQYFIAMEFVEGLSLGQLIRESGALPFSLAFEWFNQAAIGLDYLHQKKIIHRDIKPDNMMVDPSGTLKIMDFGLAKQHFEGDQSMTMSGTILGSPHYMSPEQINESKDVDGRSDIYSLGIVLYQMLTGKLPFSRTTTAAIMMAHINDSIPSVCADRADALPQIDEFIAKLTAKDRAERVPSAAALIEEIKPWLEQYPMDEEVQEFWQTLDFKSREVSEILAREKIDSKVIDREFASETVVHINKSSAMSLSFQIFATTAILLLWVSFFVTRSRPAPMSPPPDPTTQKSGVLQNASVASPKLGGVFVKTKPEGATILFQAKEKCSPASFPEVPIGHYSIKVYMAGYQETERQIEVEEDKFVNVEVVLNKDTDDQPSSAAANPPKGGPPVSKQFHPIGMTESDLIGQWGQPKGRLDFGDETQLMFLQGRAILHDGKVTDFVKRIAGREEVEDENRGNAPNQKLNYAKEDQELLLKRMQNDLSDKMKDLDQAYARARAEAQKANTGFGNPKSSQGRDEQMKQPDQSPDVQRLKGDVQRLQDEVRDQFRKVYENQ